jgi:8-oxo-dGTP pyrophosphatase MutT (NUDIX family)
VSLIDKIAWIRLEEGKILSTRSRGKDVYYIPGGKRELGETDVQTLVREIREELDVAIGPSSATHAGTFQAQAHGPSSEVDEFIWLTYADRDRGVLRGPAHLRSPAPERPADLSTTTRRPGTSAAEAG